MTDSWLLDVAIGGSLALGLTNEGVVSWGEVNSVPTTVSVHTTVSYIACGWTHALMLSQDHQVFVYGKGDQGQLGLGSVTECGDPRELALQGSAVSIACGFRTSFIIVRCEGVTSTRLYCFGDNKKGQLGLPERCCVRTPRLNASVSNVHKVASGHRHTVAETTPGVLFAWGQNSYGQFGTDQVSESSVPVLIDFTEPLIDLRCGWFHTVLLTVAQDVYMCGKGDFGQQGTCRTDHCSSFHLVLRNVQAVATGSEHVLALSNTSQVFVWGWNEHGNLGLGDKDNRSEPTELPGLAVQKIYASSAVSLFQLA